jgi:hypothetical protein
MQRKALASAAAAAAALEEDNATECIISNFVVSFGVVLGCMHRLSIAKNNSSLYAFLNPCQLSFSTKPYSIQKAGKQYIQNKLRDVKKECYLAPYLFS